MIISKVDELLGKHPNYPLKAFWAALNNPADFDTDSMMALMHHDSCGLEYKYTKLEGASFEFHSSRTNYCLTYGSTPLMLAAHANRTDVVKAFVAAGADVNAKDLSNGTALSAAAVNNNCEVRLLLEKGAAIKIKLDEVSLVSSPIQDAAHRGHTEAVKLLIEAGADVNWQDSMGSSALTHAALAGHEETVAFLLSQKGVQISLSDSYGMTALHWAANNNHWRVCELLISAGGANVDLAEMDGRTPLQLAAMSHSLDAIRSLVQCGANIEATSNDGWTALHASCKSKYTRSAKSRAKRSEKLLLDLGANVNTRDIHGQTPLHIACHRGVRSMAVIALLDQGADLNALRDDGRQPADLADLSADEMRLFISEGFVPVP